MADLKIQGVVEVTTEGAENALNRVGSAAEKMAGKVGASASEAGKAVDQIGSGAGKSADEFTRAEGRIVQSIKRATTQLEMLGKTASQRLEMRISTQGLDASKFEPALAKLRELEAAQVRTGTASKGMGQGLQNTAYQLQDFVVQVNGGTDAMRALSMQLPQMLVGFGAAGAAIGVVAALLPNVISLFSSSADESKKLSDAMSDFDKAVGEVGSTVKTFDMEGLYEQFNSSSAAVRAATLEQLNFQREFIRTSQLVAGKKFGESLSGLGEYGTLDKLQGAWGSSGAERLSKQLGISLGVAKDLLPVLNGLKAGSEDVNLAFDKFGRVLLSGNANAVDLAKTMSELAKSDRDAAAAHTALSEAQDRMSKGHVTTKKEADEAAKARNAAATAAQKEADALKTLLDTINGRASGFDSNYVKNVELLLKAYGAGKLTLEEYNAAFSAYVAMQPGAVAAERERAKLLQEQQEAQQKYMTGMGDETAMLINKAKAAEDELLMIGASADQIATLTARRYDEQIALKAVEADQLRGLDGREAELFLIEQQIAALERLKSAEVAKPRLQAQAREWDNFTRDIERSLTDALMRSFESGDSFGKAFAENLENTFKTMVLKASVQLTVGGTLSALGINTGSAGAAGAAGGALSLVGGMSNAASLYSAISGGLASSVGGGVSWLGSALGSSTLAEIGAGISGSTLAAGLAGPTTAGASGAVGIGSTIGTALPYAGAALAVAGLLGAFGGGGGPKSGGDAGYKYVDGEWQQVPEKGWMYTPNDRNSAVEALMQPWLASLSTTIERMGGTLPTGAIGLGYDSDPEGTAGNRISSIVDGVKLRSNVSIGDIPKALSAELNRMFVATAQKANLDEWAADIVKSVDAVKATDADITAAIEALNGMAQVVPLFEAIGIAADKLSVSAIKTLGGFDVVASSVSAYYENFYSEAEKTARLTEQISEALADVGLKLPATKDEFRALVEAQDLTTTAGQKAFSALMGVSSAFVAVAAAAEESSKALISAAMDRAKIESTSSADYAIRVARIKSEIPGYAAGGDFAGGLRIVGERGAEIEATGPARIWSADQTRQMLSGNSESVVGELRALRSENAAQARSIAQLQARMTKLLERWDGAGIPETRIAA